MGIFDVAASDIPAIRIVDAIGRGVNKDLLFIVGGGIGDRVCAEPTLRYALDTFRDCRISLMCSTPELFRHLDFVEVFTDVDKVPKGKHLVLHTYAQGNLANQYFNANLMHSVDYASISALRMQVPRNYKAVKMNPRRTASVHHLVNKDFSTYVVHPGESWPSRTFPAYWWDNLIDALCELPYACVAVVGNKTVSIEGNHRMQGLRGETNLDELAWLCQSADAIISNDSAPIHLAAPGRAKIAFVATCRRPDLIAHWRRTDTGRVEFGWRTMDFSKKPMWELFDSCPNNLNEQRIDEVPEGRSIEEFLPEPREIVEWVR